MGSEMVILQISHCTQRKISSCLNLCLCRDCYRKSGDVGMLRHHGFFGLHPDSWFNLVTVNKGIQENIYTILQIAGSHLEDTLGTHLEHDPSSFRQQDLALVASESTRSFKFVRWLINEPQIIPLSMFFSIFRPSFAFRSLVFSFFKIHLGR